MNQTNSSPFGNRLIMRMLPVRGGWTRKSPRDAWSRGPVADRPGADQTVNELPQPQPPLAFGLLKVKPEPWKVLT